VDGDRGAVGAHGTGLDGAGAAIGTFSLEGEYWTVALGDETVRVRDSKGMRLLAVLLRRPGDEVHSLDLVRTADGAPGPQGDDADAASAVEAGLRVDGGSAPTFAIDAHAETAYRARVHELGLEIAAAERAGDVDRATRAEDERDALLAELAAARGLGGRRRVAGSAGERARLNASRAIRAAVDRIEAGAPGVGRHLRLTVRTGLFCVYEPDPRAPVAWRP
jgi:hypothetical protein